MNEKIKKFAQDSGYCCLWAFLEANKATHPSKLMEWAKSIGWTFTKRALRYQRRTHRAGLTQCEHQMDCLAAKIKAGHTIPLHPRKGP